MSVFRRAVASVAFPLVVLTLVTSGQPARAAQLDGVPDVVALGAITPTYVQPNDVVRASPTIAGVHSFVTVLLIDEYGGTHALSGFAGTNPLAVVPEWWPSGHYRLGAIQVTAGTLFNTEAACFYCYAYYDLVGGHVYEGAYDDGFTNWRAAVSPGLPFTQEEIDAVDVEVVNADEDVAIADLESAAVTGGVGGAFPAGAAPRFTASWGVDDHHAYDSGSVSVVAVRHGVNDWSDVHTWYFGADASARSATVDLAGLPNGRYRVSSVTLLTDDRYQLQASLDGRSTYPPTIGGGVVRADLSTLRFSLGVPPDVTPPTLAVPGSVTAEAMSPAGATVSYVVSADDAVDGPVTPSCAPVSGSTFAIRTTTVTCVATDEAGNAATRSFDVRVSDTTGPVLVVPTAMTAEATSAAGARVQFATSAVDLVDGAVTPPCAPSSGSTFALGTTAVTCTATDATGNTSTTVFDVVVMDTTAPTLRVPGGVTQEATGPSGGRVTFAASAKDLVDGDTPAVCSPLSGSTFPLGTTLVTCSATDVHGNRATSTFGVLVRDTTLPVLRLTGNATIYDVDGTVSISCTVTDAVSTPTCAPPTITSPSASFGAGLHTVTFTATDAAGNRGTAVATFEVKPTVTGMINLTTARVTKEQLASSLEAKLRSGNFQAYRQQLRAQTGKGIAEADADLLTELSYALPSR